MITLKREDMLMINDICTHIVFMSGDDIYEYIIRIFYDALFFLKVYYATVSWCQYGLRASLLFSLLPNILGVKRIWVINVVSSIKDQAIYIHIYYWHFKNWAWKVILNITDIFGGHNISFNLQLCKIKTFLNFGRMQKLQRLYS